MSYLNELNLNQKEAVLYNEGPLLILAGAGAGKTRTLTYRILHLIRNGVAPENILAVTFTNKAAKEMRERIFELLKQDQNLNQPISFEGSPCIKTFHSLGVQILRENFRESGILKNFSILDKGDSQKIIKDILISLELDPKKYEPKKVLGLISSQKGKFVGINSFKEKINNSSQRGNEHFLKVTADVWSKYEQILKKEASLDFDDLLLKSALLLKNNKQVLEKYQNLWTQIHIDEYQDTNKVQYKIARLLSQRHQNICVVGDADQNIYSWRGANIQNILNFEKDFKNARTVLLEENYRSTQNILNAANQIIKKNSARQEKNLFTKNSEGELLGVYFAYTEKEEALFVAQKAKTLMEQGVSLKEMAVLYRTNFQSRVLEEAFLNLNVPYQVLGTKFFERKEIKDIMAYIKSALNPENITSLKRTINTPARGIGKVSLAKIVTGKENELSPRIQEQVQNYRDILFKIKEKSETLKTSDLIKFVIEESGLTQLYANKTEEDLEKLSNMEELVSLALKYDTLPPQEGLEKLLEEFALTSDQDEMEKDNEAVKLMTVHASKGLEFDYVFVTGLEDSLFPSRLAFAENKSQEKEEEERRLFYVALTRARKKLFLSYATVRTIFGSQKTNKISEFITDIDESLLEYESEEVEPSLNSDGEVIEYLEW